MFKNIKRYKALKEMEVLREKRKVLYDSIYIKPWVYGITDAQDRKDKDTVFKIINSLIDTDCSTETIKVDPTNFAFCDTNFVRKVINLLSDYDNCVRNQVEVNKEIHAIDVRIKQLRHQLNL